MSVSSYAVQFKALGKRLISGQRFSKPTLRATAALGGIAHAFRTPEIVNLIGQQDGVAVALFQWSSEVNEQYMIPWHLLKDPASVLSFAAKVEKAERDPDRRLTAIGGAIDFGVRLIAENAFEGRQLKIDVSGDGRSNTGLPPSIPRQEANALGVVINGLPILTYPDNKLYDLDTYYREKVILGPGAFVEIANDYDDFARAFLRKLLRELTPLVSQENAAPRALIQETRARPPNVRRGSELPVHRRCPPRPNLGINRS